MAVIGQQLTAPEIGWKRYDDKDSAIKYYGTGWSTFAQGSFSYHGTTLQATRVVGDKFEIKFKGTKIRLIDSYIDNRSNKVKITLDGEVIINNQKGTGATSADRTQTIVFERIGLEDKIHTITVETTDGDYIGLDAIDIDEWGYLVTPVWHSLSTPDQGWQRIDDGDARITYTGTWTFLTTDTNYYNKTLHSTPNRGDKVSFTIYGTAFRVIGTPSINRKSRIIVKIDGVEVDVFSQNTLTTLRVYLMYEKTGLTKGYHNIELIADTDDANVFEIDAIDIPVEDYFGMRTLATPDKGWKRYDADDVTKRIGSGWSLTKDSTGQSYESGFVYYTRDDGDYYQFIFTGDKLRLTGRMLFQYDSNVEITIDGITEHYSLYSDTTVNKALAYEKTGLPEGKHVVTVKKTSQTFMHIDAIDIDEKGRVYHPDEVMSIADLTVGKRIRCHYAGASNKYGAFSGLGKDNSAFIPSINNVTASNVPNGDFYIICVDVDHKGNKVLLADRNVHQTISWDTLNSAGVTSGLIQSHNILAPSGFGYDFEATGNVLYDCTRQYNGTITGTTVVDGYNGEGNARRFNGTSDIISIGAKIIPIGAKSIRFKFRKVNGLPSNYGVIIASNTGTSEHGDWISIRIPNGTIRWDSMRGATGSYRFSLESKFGICDGEWHDILLAWDGTTNSDSVKMYIDDMSKPHATTTAITLETVASTANVMIGRNTTGTAYYLSGDLDDLEIYSGVINPDESIFLQDDSPLFNVRIPTGGINATDKDNEWDRYIVNSDLAPTNWNAIVDVVGQPTGGVRSWATTTPTTNATHKVIRGGVPSDATPSVALWATDLTATTNGRGFRPLMIIEKEPTRRLSLVKFENAYKKWDKTWNTVSATLPSESTFIVEGMGDLSVLDRKATQFSLPAQTDITLGKGKVFKTTIDLKKFFDINKISVK